MNAPNCLEFVKVPETLLQLSRSIQSSWRTKHINVFIYDMIVAVLKGTVISKPTSPGVPAVGEWPRGVPGCLSQNLSDLSSCLLLNPQPSSSAPSPFHSYLRAGPFFFISADCKERHHVALLKENHCLPAFPHAPSSRPG